MLSNLRLMKSIAFVPLLLLALIGPAPADGQQPFNYYPAYGAHRGRIVYHQGPFGGTRQKIRWGGGITDNGAAVLLGAIDAAGPILGSVLGMKGNEETDRERGLRDAEHQRSLDDDQRLLADAEALRARTQQLLASLVGGSVQPVQPVQPIVPGVSTGVDNFQDWPNPNRAQP